MEDYSAQLPEEAKNFLSMVRSSARQMNQLIDDLLRLSRLGRQRLSKRRVSLAGLVHSVLEELRREQSERQITIEVSDLPDCMADESLLKQVFINLLSNAFKYTTRKKNPSIQVGCLQQN